MEKKVLFGVLAAMLSVSIIFAGCAPAEEVAPPEAPPLEPVRIAAITWRTGPAKDYGDHHMSGIRMAVKEIEEAGGILGGRMIEIREYDEGFTAEVVTSAVKEALADGCKAIVGGSDATTAEALGAALHRYVDLGRGVPWVCHSAGSYRIARDAFYGMAHFMFYAPLEMASTAKWAEAQGFKTGIVVAYDSEFGRLSETALRSRWDKPGSPFKLLPHIWIAYGVPRAELEIAKAVAENTDIIFLHIWGREISVTSLKRIRELDYKGTLFYAAVCLEPGDVKAVPEAVEGVYAPLSWYRDPSIPITMEWADRMVAEYGVEPDCTADQSYEATKLLLLAMDKAGTDSDLTKIADAMHSIHFMTPRGDELKLMKRSSGGAEVIYTHMFLTQAQGGKLVTVGYVPFSLEDYAEDLLPPD